MPQFALSLALVFALALSWSGSMRTRPASAQTPPSDVLCKRPNPARAVHLALADPKLIIAIAQATGPRDLANGTPVTIIRVVKGSFAAKTAVADRRPTIACLSDGVWDARQPVVGVFLIDGDQLFTLAAWPFVDGHAQAGGQSLTIDELLARGRAFVEPTATPLPPGVAPPPILVPPDTGAPSSLPPTGQPSSSGSGLAGWLAGALVAAATGAGLVYGVRRRG